jgi:hypothetical protein
VPVAASLQIAIREYAEYRDINPRRPEEPPEDEPPEDEPPGEEPPEDGPPKRKARRFPRPRGPKPAEGGTAA